MSWSKVQKGKKSFIWWYHKLLCELGYWIEHNVNAVYGLDMYYKHLNMCCKQGYDLYGRKI